MADSKRINDFTIHTVQKGLNEFGHSLRSLDKFGKTATELVFNDLFSNNSKVPILSRQEERNNHDKATLVSLSPTKDELFILEKVKRELVHVIKLENKQKEYHVICCQKLQETLDQLSELKKHVSFYQTAVSFTIQDDLEAVRELESTETFMHSIGGVGGLGGLLSNEEKQVLQMINVIQTPKVAHDILLHVCMCACVCVNKNLSRAFV